MKTESDLKSKCFEYLDDMGYEYIHIPNRVFRKWKNTKLKSFPDFVIFLPGKKTIFIELKPFAKLSDGQVDKIERLNKLGHPVCIVQDLIQFKYEIFKELGR